MVTEKRAATWVCSTVAGDFKGHKWHAYGDFWGSGRLNHRRRWKAEKLGFENDDGRLGFVNDNSHLGLATDGGCGVAIDDGLGFAIDGGLGFVTDCNLGFVNGSIGLVWLVAR